MKITVGIIYTTVDFDGDTLKEEKVKDHMHHKLGVKDPNAIHSRAYKSGAWDGITDYYDMKENSFPTGLINLFLEGIREMQEYLPNLTYELIDNRPSPLLHPDNLDKEIELIKDGQTITLRDYQYRAVEAIIRDQIGIVNLATNAGKTMSAAGIIKILMPLIGRNERIVFMVHSKDILSQAKKSITEALGMKEKDVGLVGEGKFDIKNKKLVFVMSPTLSSALSDPKKGVTLTQKDRLVKKMAEEIAPKFLDTVNTRTLIKNFLKNWKPKTKNDVEIEQILTALAYDNAYTDKKVQMVLRSYNAEFEKILLKKNKKNFEKWKTAKDFVESVRVFIGDEAHRIKGDTWYTNALQFSNAQYRVALTGTVDKKDVHLYQRIRALFNDIIVKVSNDELISRGVSSKPKIRMLEIKEPRGIELADNYMEAYKVGISQNDYRNDMAVQVAVAFYEKKKAGVLFSVNHIEHGESIQEKLRAKGYECSFLKGELELDERKEVLDKFSSGEIPFMIGTTIIDEGLDLSCIGCLVLAGAGKSLRQILQRIGRGLRLNGIDGNQTLVIDFIDKTHKILLKHSKERLKIYQEEKFDVKMLGAK
ncbi:DNA helicase [Bacillus phage CAM003]|uniref:DNA helicase n=1 Tax=Bacillus phage CAM003 TaxID=1486657 RepID=A0A024B018_9CAUD|nr:DNA helicase [Bacillus phage CAM003]AHZ09541.1 DNA helicase [Bacillus phage CAM003]AXF42212.1 DNA helicase I [Bacillus phage Maceta]